MKWPSAPKVLTGLLVVLLPVLAYMQYRWVGQVSEGERERMQRNLETAADQFRADFDGEFIRAIRELTVGTTTAREGSSSNYTLRYTSWLNTADHPQLVADVYFVDAAGDQLRLRRYNNGTHVFEPSLWPEELDRHRADFEAAYKDFKADRESNRRIRTAFSDEESLFVSQLQNFEVRPGAQPTVTAPLFGYTIIQLDESYLRGQMIPALAERHFTERGGEMYRVAVILGDDSKRVMYRSTPEATTDVSNADITAALLPPPPRGGRRGGRGGANQQAAEEAPPRWRLLVQHQSGSLDAAVGTIRRRNLAISSRVLLLLTF